MTLNFEHQSVADQAWEVSVEVLAIAQFVSVFPIGGRAYSIPQAAVCGLKAWLSASTAPQSGRVHSLHPALDECRRDQPEDL